MNFKFINSLVKERNGSDLADILSLEANLDTVDTRKVYSPYGEILTKQKQLLGDKTYECAEDVVKASLGLLEEGRYVYPILKRVINNSLLVLKYNGNETNKESLAKILFGFTRNSGDNEIKYFTFNVLFQLYFEMGKFELLENLLLISENNRRGKKDYYVYHFYKGMVLFYLDRFIESFDAFRIAFRSRKIRYICALPYFLCGMMNGRFPRESALVEYKCETLLKITQAVKYGIVTQVDSELEEISNILVLNHLFRPCYTYLPLVAFCNLVRRLYHMFSSESKLEIEKIKEATGLDYLEIFSLLTSAINLSLIKGYVSVNKGVVVFSKVDPFVGIINI